MTSADDDSLAALARQLSGKQDLIAVLQRVVEASVEQIDGAERAGVTMLSRKEVATLAATDDVVVEIDKHQYAVGEGPCLSAALNHEQVVLTDDLTADPRWPRFTLAIADFPVRSMLSFQLYTDAGERGDTIGALNIYAAAAAAFTDESVHTGTLLAAHAAVAAVAADQRANLQIALHSRDIIGQAKGILMERYKIRSEQAFDLLIAVSQRTNRKLREVADTLADTGEL